MSENNPNRKKKTLFKFSKQYYHILYGVAASFTSSTFRGTCRRYVTSDFIVYYYAIIDTPRLSMPSVQRNGFLMGSCRHPVKQFGIESKARNKSLHLERLTLKV